MARRNDVGSKDPNGDLAENAARRATARGEYMAVLDQRGNALLSVNEKSGTRSREYVTLDARLGHDEAEYERIKTALRRPVAMMQIRPLLLAVTGIVLALLEAPANKFLFDVALQSSGLVSYAASAGTTAFLLILAHFAGTGLRQTWSEMRRAVLVWNLFTFLLCTIVALAIVGVLTVARAAFASEAGSIGDLLTNVRGHVENLGPLGALASALSDTSALVLACINIGGIVTTFMLAFFSHDPDRDFDHVHRAVAAGEKQLARLHAAYLKNRAKIIAEYSPHLIGYSANYNSANSRVIELKTILGRPLDDDDRVILTDLDQMAEEAEQADAAATGSARTEGDSTVRDMRDYRRPAANEGT